MSIERRGLREPQGLHTVGTVCKPQTARGRADYLTEERRETVFGADS
jgi:hypothetical protein